MLIYYRKNGESAANRREMPLNDTLKLTHLTNAKIE